MRSRLEHAARDVAEGNITLEEVIGVIRNASGSATFNSLIKASFIIPPKSQKL
jgi:hypothetical protein